MASPQISDKELDEIYAFAIQLGKDAGKMLMDRATLRMSGPSGQEEQKFEEKENAVDIVTQTDTGRPDCSYRSSETAKICGGVGLTGTFLDVEAFIHTSISKRYPHHKYVSLPSSRTEGK